MAAKGPSYTSRMSSGFVLALLVACFATPARGIEAAVPVPAKSAGYLLNTFSSTYFDAATVDQALSFSRGFKWYNSNIINGRQQRPEHNVLNADGSITTFSLPLALGLVSAANVETAPRYVGQAFGGGGYFEAELRFDAEKVDLKDNVWPAFWTVSLESSASLPGQHWAGQPPNYNHTVELDIFEYLYGASKPRNVYGATGHEFFGIYGVTCPPNRCKVHSRQNERIAPIGTDWSRFHKFGMLWVPASESHKGKVEFYFDGALIGSTIHWDKYHDQAPPITPASTWNFGVVDTQHLILILSSGKSAPMTVRSVNVWQSTDQFNLRN